MPLLEVRDVSKRYPVRAGLLRQVRGWVKAVDRVSLSVEPGETLGLVGESGCGKTTLGRMMLGLIARNEGEVSFDGRPLDAWLKQPSAFRQRIQVVFQDPLDSLDPRYTIEQVIAEPLRALRVCAPGEVSARVREALRSVQLPEELMGSYPHELSGGQRQRVGIARAMALRPKLVVCDEPVSSLDLSIQAQVLQLLHKLQRELGVAYLLISHDLGVVQAMSRRIAVMYLGSIVEIAPAAELMRDPWHPYTQALLAAVPRPDPERHPVQLLQGDPPSPRQIPSGCRFRTRCPLAQGRCEQEEPQLVEAAPGRFVACHFAPAKTVSLR